MTLSPLRLYLSLMRSIDPEVTMTLKIKVNDTDHEVDVDGDTPLLWVLRDVLGMTGTKFGCGKALCGACTVHLNGGPMRSCIFPIESVGDSAVRPEREAHHRRHRRRDGEGVGSRRRGCP